MEAKFNIDLSRLVELLPFGMRSASIVGLFRAGFSPFMVHLADMFREARADDHRRIRCNGQVCHLRAALNAKFKSNLKGIYFQIGDNPIDREWTFAKKEGATSHTFARTEPEPTIEDKIARNGKPRKVTTWPPFNPPYASSEIKPGERYSFIVYVPSDLYHSYLPQIKHFVDQYRLVSRQPNYEPINS